jgi:hypothetical protein
MRQFRLLPALLPLLCCVPVLAQQAPPANAPLDIDQARKSLAVAARQACVFEYENPNFHAQLLSIGWETGPFCSCIETKLLTTLTDDVTRQATAWIDSTQNKLKTAADLALLANQPQVAEFLKLARNAKGKCLYQKMPR